MPMIATNQRRPDAPIELGPNRERVYFFKPSNPADAGSVHIAEVTDDDYDHLIKIEGYFAFRGTIKPAAAKPVATPQAPAVPATDPPANTPPTTAAIDPAAASTPATTEPATPAAPATEPPADDLPTSAEIEEAAQNLLGLSWQMVGAQLDRGGIPTEVAQRALDIELAKPEDEQKLTIVKKLRAALGAN